MEILFAIIAGLLAGAVGVWIQFNRRLHELALDKARLERDCEAERAARRQAAEAAEREKQALSASAEARIAELRQLQEQQLQELRNSEVRLRTQLEALLPGVAQQVLGSTSQQLSELARRDLKAIGDSTAHAVGQSNTALRTAVEQMQQQMTQYQQRIQQLETERVQSSARLELQIAGLQDTGANMHQEARRLREALQSGSGVRGNWGQLELQRIFESCGLTEGISFELQSTLTGEDEKKWRPDAIVRLPSGRNLVIDSKANLKYFLEGLDQVEEVRRREKFQQLADSIKDRIKDLAAKEYSRNLENSVPCVVMFVPSEAAYRAAVETDPALFAYGTDRQPPIILATPTTLMPLILTIGYGWQQLKTAREAERLHRELQEFINRLRVYIGHVDNIGKGLGVAVLAYDEARGSYNRRLLPQTQRMEEMGADFSSISEPRALPAAAAALPPAPQAARAAGEGE